MPKPVGFFIFLFFVVMASNSDQASASDSSNDPVNPGLLEVIETFYATDWERTRELLDSLKAESSDPSVFFYDSMLPFWAYFFAGGDRDDAKDFLSRSEKAIDISNRHLRSARNDTSTVLLLSGLHGYRSLVAASEREYRTAIRSAMTGFGYTRQLLSLDSDDPNAKMGRGVFNYMMGTVPSEIRWATSFAGLSGDRETGFKELEEAARAGTHVSTDALMILTYLYMRDEEYESALRTAGELTEKHPQNVIFRYYLAQALEKNDRPEEAAAAYRKVLEMDNPNLPNIKKSAVERLEVL